jgi:hypothetical protein
MPAGPFDFGLGIGCLFTPERDDRARYAGELARLLQPGGECML